MGRVGPSLKKNSLKKDSFKKNVIFRRYFIVLKYWFVFLYYKDTNPVLKYLIFVKKNKKNKKNKIK